MRWRRKRYSRRYRRPFYRRRHYRRYRRRFRGLRPEKKHKEYVCQTSITSTWDTIPTGDYGLLTQITAGSGGRSRIGDRIKVKRLTIKGALLGGQVSGTTDDAYNQVRVVVMLGTPGIAMANQLATGGIGLYTPLLAGTIPFVQKILYDRVIHLQSPGASGTGFMPCIKHFKLSKRINRTCVYQYASTLPTKWEVYVCVVSDSSTVPNPGFQGTTVAWLSYYDN